MSELRKERKVENYSVHNFVAAVKTHSTGAIKTQSVVPGLVFHSSLCKQSVVSTYIFIKFETIIIFPRL